MVARVKNMSVIMLVLLCVILGVVGQLSMKKGTNTIGDISLRDIFSTKVFSILLQKYILIGMILYVLASLIWLAALSREELSFLYPLIAIGYILTAILGKIFFDESLTFWRFFGILLICGGVYLIVLKV